MSAVIAGLAVILAQVCVVRLEGIGSELIGSLDFLLTGKYRPGKLIFYNNIEYQVTF